MRTGPRKEHARTVHERQCGASRHGTQHQPGRFGYIRDVRFIVGLIAVLAAWWLVWTTALVARWWAVALALGLPPLAAVSPCDSAVHTDCDAAWGIALVAFVPF